MTSDHALDMLPTQSTANFAASTERAKRRGDAVSTESRVDATTESLLDSEPHSQSRPHDWRRAYGLRLWITDLLALIWVVYGTQIAWFGLGNAQLAILEDNRITDLSYWAFSTALIIVWMSALSWSDSRSHRVVGTGVTEYVRVGETSLKVFGTIAILAFLTRIEVARGFLLMSLPLGVLVLLLTRWLWRQWLIVKREKGQYCARVLLVGSAESVTQIAQELSRTPQAGYRMVGACCPTGTQGETLTGADFPLVGSVDDINHAMSLTHADTVAVTSTDELPPSRVKQVSWELQAGQQHLVLAPSITDVAGPRLHTRPVAGLPLIHVETPRFSKGQVFLKRTLDIAASSIGLLLISRVLVFLAATIRLTSTGPVLFRQTRVGRGGREFTMLKVRSMVVNAEDLLENLQRQREEAGIDSGNEILFKMKDDPRVTPIGRIMRKYSLDELPQLLNVVRGTMSLVGPWPPLRSEVEQYADHVHRRFLVKPGITGLWQVSGRSMLSWEETVRLDLSYVENWTLLGDIAILAKTAEAALVPGETASWESRPPAGCQR